MHITSRSGLAPSSFLCQIAAGAAMLLWPEEKTLWLSLFLLSSIGVLSILVLWFLDGCKWIKATFRVRMPFERRITNGGPNAPTAAETPLTPSGGQEKTALENERIAYRQSATEIKNIHYHFYGASKDSAPSPVPGYAAVKFDPSKMELYTSTAVSSVTSLGEGQFGVAFITRIDHPQFTTSTPGASCVAVSPTSATVKVEGHPPLIEVRFIDAALTAPTPTLKATLVSSSSRTELGDRISVLELFEKAERSGLRFMGDGDDVLGFVAALRQAGSDGTLTFWGRDKHKSDPLIAIPAAHWREFSIDWMEIFVIGPPSGQIKRFKADNFPVGSRTLNHRTAYLDLQVDAKALKWLPQASANEIRMSDAARRAYAELRNPETEWSIFADKQGKKYADQGLGTRDDGILSQIACYFASAQIPIRGRHIAGGTRQRIDEAEFSRGTFTNCGDDFTYDNESAPVYTSITVKESDVGKLLTALAERDRAALNAGYNRGTYR